MKPEKRPIPIRLDPETIARIDRVVQHDKSMEGNRSLFIRQAIHERLERFEKPEVKEAA